MNSLAALLLETGLLQFGRFITDDGPRPYQLQLDLLPSYPDVLAHITELAAPWVGDVNHLLSSAEALPFGVSLSLRTHIPLVYARGTDALTVYELAGAYDIGHPALLLGNTLAPSLITLAEKARVVGEGEVCRAGLCEVPETDGKRDWFGVHFGTELASLSAANDVCSGDAGFACFDGDDAYEGTPYRGNGGAVTSGFHPGTMRVMLSYERFLLDQFSLGVRFGFAFSGAPEDFFPLHFEGRATYYFADVTRGRSTFAPYVALGFGLAQVDSRVEVEMVDCLPDQLDVCQQATQVDQGLVDPETGAARLRTLDAYKTLGKAFGTIAPGLTIKLSRKASAVVNLGVLLMTEENNSSAIIFALQPSLGLAIGF